MEEILKEILGEIKNINTRLDSMDTRLNNLEDGQKSISFDIKELKENTEVQFKITNGLITGATNKIDDLKSNIDNIDAKNANKHLELYGTINELHKDIKFIKHKIHVNEEEIFDIKDHLKLVK